MSPERLLLAEYYCPVMTMAALCTPGQEQLETHYRRVLTHRHPCSTWSADSHSCTRVTAELFLCWLMGFMAER